MLYDYCNYLFSCVVVLLSIGETTLSTVHRTKFQTEGEQGDKKHIVLHDF